MDFSKRDDVIPDVSKYRDYTATYMPVRAHGLGCYCAVFEAAAFGLCDHPAGNIGCPSMSKPPIFSIQPSGTKAQQYMHRARMFRNATIGMDDYINSETNWPK